MATVIRHRRIHVDSALKSLAVEWYCQNVGVLVDLLEHVANWNQVTMALNFACHCNVLQRHQQKLMSAYFLSLILVVGEDIRWVDPASGEVRC